MSKKKNSFSKMLKEHEKKVTVSIGEKEFKITDLTDLSADNVVCTSLDSVVPVSVTEAVDGVTPGASGLSVDTSYAQTAWSLYESSLKFPDVKQSMLLLQPASSIEAFLDGDFELSELEPLLARTNLQLILDKMPEKNEKRLKKWAESPEKFPDMFVVRIPNVVLFVDSIKKGAATSARFFNLVICFVATEKKITKLRKKNNEEYKEAVQFAVERAVSVLKDFGTGSVHIGIESAFMKDPYDYAAVWGKTLMDAVDKKDILTKMTFCTTDANVLVEFSGEIGRVFTTAIVTNF